MRPTWRTPLGSLLLVAAFFVIQSSGLVPGLGPLTAYADCITSPNPFSATAPAYINTTSVNITIWSQTGGDCSAHQVAASNDHVNWSYGHDVNGYIPWNIATGDVHGVGGGNSNQGTHVIYTSFQEGGQWMEDWITLTYDTVAPTVTTTLSIGAATRASSPFTINWSASDSSGIANAATYVWTRPSVNGQCTGPVSFGGAISYAVSGSASSGFTNGNCVQYEAQANDNAGNWGGAAMTQWVLFSRPPTVSTSLSVGGAAYTNSTSITVYYSVTDNSGAGIQNWELYDQQYPGTDGNGNCTGAVIGWSGLAYGNGAVSGGTYNSTGLANGTCYQWGLNANDNAGNHGYQTNGEGGASPTQWVMIDTGPPSASISVPYANYTNQTSFATTYAASDAASGISSWVLNRRSAPASGNACQTGSASGWTQLASGSSTVNTTYTNSSLANATCYQWGFNSWDNAGNLSQVGTAWLMIDTTPPSASNSVPYSGYTNQTSFNYTYSAADGVSGVLNWQINRQSAPVSGNTCQVGNASGWTSIASGFGAVTNGTYANSSLANATCYQWGFNSWDNAGNLSQVGTAWLMIDTTPPSAPSTPILAPGSDTGSSSTDGLTRLATGLVFSGTAEANSTVTVYNGATALGFATASSGGAYSVTTTVALAGGAYTITAKAADPAGNVSPVSGGYAVVIHATCPN